MHQLRQRNIHENPHFIPFLKNGILWKYEKRNSNQRYNNDQCGVNLGYFDEITIISVNKIVYDYIKQTYDNITSNGNLFT
jgi:hypothetical protein